MFADMPTLTSLLTYVDIMTSHHGNRRLFTLWRIFISSVQAPKVI